MCRVMKCPGMWTGEVCYLVRFEVMVEKTCWLVLMLRIRRWKNYLILV